MYAVRICTFLTRPNPASVGCNSQCRITFCHTCYYADEYRPLPGDCDTCSSYPLATQANARCFRRWSVCVRRANGALYTKVSNCDNKGVSKKACPTQPIVKCIAFSYNIVASRAERTPYYVGRTGNFFPICYSHIYLSSGYIDSERSSSL